YHHGILRRRKLSGLRMKASANPTTTKNDVAIVKHRCLPRSHSSLRIAQSYMGATIFELHHRRAGPWMAIPNLYCHFRFFAVAGGVDPGSLHVDCAAAANARGNRLPIPSIVFESS